MAEKKESSRKRRILAALLAILSIDRVIAIVVAVGLTTAVSAPLAITAVEAQREADRIEALPENVETSFGEVALADERSAMAERLGAANTLVFDPADGTLADNTDGFGFIENLRGTVSGWEAGAGPVTVLGAGGAARAVIVALLEAGVSELRLLNRTKSRAEALRDEIAPGVTVLDWNEAEASLAGASLVVNATSMGMAGGPEMALSLHEIGPDTVATDIVYARGETPFLTAAKGRGATVVDGFGMLLHQARPGFERWFGRAPEVDDDLRAAVLA